MLLVLKSRDPLFNPLCKVDYDESERFILAENLHHPTGEMEVIKPQRSAICVMMKGKGDSKSLSRYAHSHRCNLGHLHKMIDR